MYILSACQLKRLDATRRSPLYTMLGESVAGAQSIRAYRLEDQFIARMEKLLNRSQSVSYELNAANRLDNELQRREKGEGGGGR